MIVSIVISVCASVISGVVVFLVQRYIKRHEDTEKKGTRHTERKTC